MNAREELHELLDEQPDRADLLLRVIDEDRLDGSSYISPCCCVYGWIDAEYIAQHRDHPDMMFDRIEAWRRRFGAGGGTALENFVFGVIPRRRPGYGPDAFAESDRKRAELRGWIVEWQERRAAVEVVAEQLVAV